MHHHLNAHDDTSNGSGVTGDGKDRILILWGPQGRFLEFGCWYTAAAGVCRFHSTGHMGIGYGTGELVPED